jgi:hypothetical protein
VILSSYTDIVDNGSFEDSPQWVNWSTTVYYNNVLVSTWSPPGVTLSTSPTSAGVGLGLFYAQVWVISDGGAGESISLFNDSDVLLENYGSPGTTGISTITLDTSGYKGQTGYIKFYASSPLCSNSSTGGGKPCSISLKSANFVVLDDLKMIIQKVNPTNGYRGGWTFIDNITNFQYYSSGTYTSDPYNMVSVSSHSTFETDIVTNNGSIDFQYRTGSNTLDLATAPYKSIIPGSIINSYSSHTWFQFHSSFTLSAGTDISPELLSVTINWFQGSANLQPIHIRDWNNRLWVSASTGTATSNNVELVKSRYPSSSWVPYTMNIGAITKFNDLFYGGASTSAAIYRMDYGDNDDGVAIDWYWTSRDEVWGSPWLNKQLYEISSDFRKNNAINAYVGYSIDGGVSYTEKPVIMSGSGRSTDRRFVGSGKSQSYRIKIGDRAKDEKATILGVSGWAFLEKLRQ